MSTLTLRNAEQKDALVQAVAYMNDYLNDTLGDACRNLEYAYDASFDEAMREITDLRKRLAFVQAFAKAVADVPVGISVFLEPLETEVIREGLQSLVDFQDDFEDESPSIEDILSVENIQQAIIATNTGWGSVDPFRLSQELNRQVRETVDGNSAAQDLLFALV